MRVLYISPMAYGDAVRAGADAGVDAIVVWVAVPNEPAEAVAGARGKGIPVVTLERLRYPVEASVVYPNLDPSSAPSCSAMSVEVSDPGPVRS
jgi:hypothetical protein